MSPVALGLRMNVWITIHLRGRGLEDTGPDPLGQTEGVDRPHDGCLHRLDGIVLIVRRGCRAGEIIDAVDLELERVDHVVTNEFKTVVPLEMLDVGLSTGEEVVETDHFISLFNKTIAEMRTKKSGSAGNQDTHKNNLKLKANG